MSLAVSRSCRVRLFLFVAVCLFPVRCLRPRGIPEGLAFVGGFPSAGVSLRAFRHHAEDFGADEGAACEDYQDDAGEYGGEEGGRVQEALSPSVNTVTLCGRIGFVDQPVMLGSGYKALRIAVATNERGRMGVVRTLWHKVVLYGQGNVDYVHSRARVGDRALVVGSLSYYSPQQPEGTQYRAKISEVAVRSRGHGHSFILLPRVKYPGDEFGSGSPDEGGYNYSNA